MPDIALLGDSTFLFERLFKQAGVEFIFLKPEMLGSPFLPQVKVLMIPTGFANQQYSRACSALERHKDGIARFIENGGVLVVFGPLVTEHSYQWLPMPLLYHGEYSAAQMLKCAGGEASCICDESSDCDGYLEPGDGYSTVLTDSLGRPVLVTGTYGRGMIVVTTVHEFPSADFIRFSIKSGKASRL